MLAAPFFPTDRPFVTAETLDAFTAIMDRLDLILDAETDAMRRHDHRGLAESARQKRQGLLELNRIMKTIEAAIPSTEIMSRLATFRAKLAINQGALKIQLDAMKAVTGTIVRIMRDLDSDGTYSRSEAGGHGQAFGYDDL